MEFRLDQFLDFSFLEITIVDYAIGLLLLFPDASDQVSPDRL
jgi:hypothetical protein